MFDEPNAYCPVCGNGMDLSPRELNAERAPCCCEDCEREFEDENPRDTRTLEEKWREGMAELNYRGGYEYACGYHD